MNRKIIGITVGTPISISKIGSELKPVKTVNSIAPDLTGNVKILAEDVGAPTKEQLEELSYELDNLPKADWIAKKEWQGDDIPGFEKTILFERKKVDLYPLTTFSIQPSIQYSVLWDGVAYELTGKTYEYKPYLGNGSLDHDGAPDTGEPFCFSTTDYSDICSRVTKSTSDLEEITFKVVTGNCIGFNKLPFECLPDGVVKRVNGIAPDEYGNVHVDGSGGTSLETDETLKLADGKLSVNTTDTVEKSNHLPVTSAAVYSLVGDIEAALAAL